MPRFWDQVPDGWFILELDLVIFVGPFQLRMSCDLEIILFILPFIVRIADLVIVFPYVINIHISRCFLTQVSADITELLPL